MTGHNKEKNFVSAVVYVHNEEERVEKFLTVLESTLKQHFAKYEIIFVNDDSTDHTVDKIKTCAEKMNGSVVTILNMSYYQGAELSMNAGVDLSIGDFVYEFDSIDIDYTSDDIIRVYNESLKGFDIVSASADKKMRITSSLFYRMFNKYSNLQYALETESFRILSRRAINRVHGMSEIVSYRKAVYANCGLEIKNIKYASTCEYKERASKQSTKKKKEIATNSLIVYTNIAHRFTSLMTLLMIAVTIAVGIYAIVVFTAGDPIAGWTTMMLFLSFGFFGTFAILSVVLKYLVVILNLNIQKQKYVYESIEKISR